MPDPAISPDQQPDSAPQLSSPFVLELRQENAQSNGNFTPQAAVLITPALRRSDLLKTLPSDEWQMLLAVLSCLTPNGTFCASPELLAPSLGLSQGQAHERLQRLTKRLWQEKPLVSEQPTESGLRFFVPSPTLLRVQQVCVLSADALQGSANLLSGNERIVQGGHRQEIIAQSRARYGRPRHEVEAQIHRFLRGEPMEEEIPTTPEEEAHLHLKGQLLAVGLTREEADVLLDTYPPDHIQRQLDWLPLRHARNPAAYLLAAIEGDYEPPLAARRQRRIPREIDAQVTDIRSANTVLTEMQAEAQTNEPVGEAKAIPAASIETRSPLAQSEPLPVPPLINPLINNEETAEPPSTNAENRSNT